MASSQLEMASSPYEHVLRDYNRRARDTEVDISSRPRATFKKNFKDLVRDHFQPCNVLAFPRDPYAGSDENCHHQQQFENRDCWVRVGDQNGDRNFGSGSNRADTRVECPAMARTNSQILDRWAARQAREMMTTLERQGREDELTQLSNSHTVSTRTSSFQRDSTPVPQDSSVDLANLRASSLVQMWKEFEAEVRLPTAKANQSGGSVNFRNNSTMSNASVESELFESNDERYGGQEDSSTDWESDLTAPSEHLSPSNGRNSSDTSERVRVVDIIRKLTLGSQTESSWSDEIEHDHHESIMSGSSSLDHSVSNHDGQRNLRFISNMPRVRGRQAIIDLMKQMEQERLREIANLRDRHAVSRFTQRGRIQSLLRLRFLRQRNSVQDRQRPISTASELDQLHCQTTIVLLRERFNGRIRQEDEVIAVPRREHNLTCTVLSTETLNSRNSSNAVENSSQDFHHQEVAQLEQNNNPEELHPMASPSNHSQEEVPGLSDLTWQGTSSGFSDFGSQRHVEIAETLHNSQGHDEDAAATLNDREGENEIIEETNLHTSQHIVESVDSWEGLGVPEEPDFAEPTDMSWISNASGPPINWEGHRPAWSSEMLENNLDNDEIRELLERRSVSNLLASGFRARMERLVLSYLRRQRNEEVFESAEEENHFEHQYHEDYVHMASTSLQLPLPSQLRSWSQYQDHEVSDDYDHVPSTSLQRPQSNTYYDDTPQFPSFTNHSSLSQEMELICNIRGHLVKLHQEMAELRKSMESCMGMQVMLRNSIKQEVATAVSRSLQEEAKEFFKQGPMQKGNCCICYDMKIDSLLYRCGHMCTCFNCASELQWSSSRCPICRAPILDVVRAYPDS